jgi:hypothetical protein
MGADEVRPSEAQVRAAAEGRETHSTKAHSGGSAGRLNWLRAAVLGAISFNLTDVMRTVRPGNGARERRPAERAQSAFRRVPYSTAR